MDALLIIITVMLCFVALPVLAYITTKLCTYAYFRGRQVFEERQENEDHGKK